MSGKLKVLISISELTSSGIIPSTTGTSNLNDGCSEATVMTRMHDHGHFVCPEEEGPCERQSHGLYFCGRYTSVHNNR